MFVSIDVYKRQRQHQEPYALGVSQKTLELIKQGLMGVAQAGGTASYFANLPKPMAAKTGTAENPHGRDHGSVSYTHLDVYKRQSYRMAFLPRQIIC